ncbi:MAG: protein kinase [Deltaproteobacteria bacterium]|nr:protein kinase [Deltaproteobacteria bacterium]
MARADVAPKPPIAIGGRFELESELGRGGMGVVYAATDTKTSTRVALKLLDRSASDPITDRRFRREFQTLVGLAHPRIVAAYDYGVDRRGLYYTMDLLDGQDLDAAGRFDVAKTCRVLRDIASALAFLHARRLIHRDVKLKNVRLTASGDAKLMDFGLLATSGIAPDDVAGTPSYLAPECLRMAVLDHRADLFSLGAVAYRLLTGKAPFPAKAFEVLEELWKEPVAAPSELAPGVPPALDALVLSLLSVDPLGRPTSAAEIIDRVTAIGGLAPLPEIETARGYLASASLVGRGAEMKRLHRTLRRAIETGAASATIEAASGEGKSRLLREIAIEAQLAGATPIGIDCSAPGETAFGVLKKVTEALLELDEKGTRRAAASHRAALGRILPIAFDAQPRGAPDRRTLVGDLAEDRLRVQAEIASFLLRAVEGHRIALLLDDVQRCDEGSAAALASLVARAGKEQLLLVCAVRTDEPPRAPAAIEVIRSGAERIVLGGLSEEATRALVVASFGDVPSSTRFAHALHVASGGSPIQITELLRDLVDAGVARYDGGLWHLPDELPTTTASGLGAAMDARVAALPPKARALAGALAVHGGRLALEPWAVLAGIGDDEIDAPVRDLVVAGFVAFADDLYRIRHDGFREALLRALGDEERRRIHLAVGRALAAMSGRDRPSPAEIGRHLLAAGQALEGAELLERAGREAYDAMAFDDAIRMLERAMEVYEEHGLYPKRCLELRVRIVGCALQCSKAALDRHAPRTIDALERAAGIGSVRALRRSLPFGLAFLFGVAWAWLRWGVRFRSTLHPVAAITELIAAITYVATASAVSGDLPSVRAAVERLAVFAPLKKRIPGAAPMLAQAFYRCQIGAWTTAHADLHEVRDIFVKDRLTPLREIDRRMGEGGARMAIASLLAQDQKPEAIAWLTDVEGLDLRFFGVGAKASRVIYHRLRGEEARASALEREMEIELLQGGSLWVFEAQLTWLSALAYVLTRDLMGMKRAIERIEDLCSRGHHYVPVLELVRAEHARETGDLVAARLHIERCLATLPEEELRVREQALLARAELALSECDWGAATTWAREALATTERPECGRVTTRLLAIRVLALAVAEHGDVEEARALLAKTDDECATIESPMLHVEMALAKARVERVAQDPEKAEAFARLARSWAERSGNPALAARAQLRAAPTSSSRTLGDARAKDADTIVDPSSTGDRDDATRTAATSRTPSPR